MQNLDKSWNAKYDRLNEEWEDRIRLLKGRQTGLSDVERAELKEQLRFVQNKAEVNFRAKENLESQIRTLEEKLSQSGKDRSKLVAEISDLQQEVNRFLEMTFELKT